VFCYVRWRLKRRFYNTSPAGAVAKYFDEYVCLCVCLSVRKDISGTTGAIFPKFLCVLPRSSSGMLTIGRIAYRREGVMGVHSAGEV